MPITSTVKEASQVVGSRAHTLMNTALPKALPEMHASGRIFSSMISSAARGNILYGSSASLRSHTKQTINYGLSQAARTKCTVTAAESITIHKPSFSFIQLAKDNPFTFGVLVATVKTGACDLLMQYYSGNEHIDWNRFKLFVGFGFAYLGVFQWLIYVTLFKRLFPGMATFANQSLREKLKNKQGMKMLVGQVAFDNFIHYTFIYFPVFYVFKEILQQRSEIGDEDETSRSPADVIFGGLSAYQVNAVQDNLAIWALWVPGDFVVYAVPIWLRLPLNHGVSFVWTCILSALRGSNKES
ncbi:hypothetical protein CYMTET_44709 [Cymbomonas tetramitiformis]|uniref:Uncharacterized protein n=1 Tax=Cymbomonas tetramitiformis TaxID=36881 RepID=A0AAE0F0F3_9CHLO|nr:hypothetical protein CYMTET_44709 [Cymbomonas tetramitiformis]